MAFGEILSGIVEKMGETRWGIGHVWPLPGNLALAYSRLATVAFPGWALLFYLLGWAVRLPLVYCLLSAPKQAA